MNPKAYESAVFMSKGGDDGCPREISLSETVIFLFFLIRVLLYCTGWYLTPSAPASSSQIRQITTVCLFAWSSSI